MYAHFLDEWIDKMSMLMSWNEHEKFDYFICPSND